ncbi:MAG: two-component system response regulator [Candidatus Cloacimonadota bacterium]|nr:MAG: two-component system response regulator [Candidatus Cloacimonadota bacterium]PIE77548.1 MAG: two-component system response regulator [Candidatus Delongbacteria bacterium]
MKILVVDDSPTMRRIVINSLKRIGYKDICEGGNGIEGLDQLQTGGIGLIVTDWNMPEMNGLEFVKKVRASSEWGSIPILMVTTRSVQGDVIEAMKAGVNSYIVKPFTPPVLKEKIESILK